MLAIATPTEQGTITFTLSAIDKSNNMLYVSNVYLGFFKSVT